MPLDQNRIQPLSQLEFFARQVVEGFITGLHKSPFHGFSVEFAEHRLYNTGESVKHIDWKLFGRTDRLYVKRYEEETNLRCHIVIDQSSSMLYPLVERPSLKQPNKLLFSVYAAAVLMQLFKRQRDAVGLSTFDNQLVLNTRAGSGAVHLQQLYAHLESMLERVSPSRDAKTSAAQSLHLLAEALHRRSLVVLFSDMFETDTNPDELFSALQHLKHNKHEVILFHVAAQATELEFEFDNRPHRFIDLETGKELKLNPLEVRELYTSRTKNYLENIKLRCNQYRIDFVEADINRGFEQVMVSWLLKRGRMM